MASEMGTEEKLRYLLRRVSADLDSTQEQVRQAEEARHEPIAVIGMSCRLPGGADTPDALWRLLVEGGDGIVDFPTGRGWDLDGLFDADPDRTGTSYVETGGFLDDVAGFDADFFDIAPREAMAMDPQQRILLETGWAAVENAGIAPDSLRGRTVGVYIGTNGQDYPDQLRDSGSSHEGYVGTGNAASVLSGRLSYVLGLRGPSVTLDTACSASLVAIHLAAEALRRGECEQALAGGVTIMSSPRLFVEFSRQRALAPDGRCKPFARAADGTGWGEGAGVLVLERLSAARRRGHPVLALVTGTAVNSDGASNGLSAPNGPAQQQVIRTALAAARITPADIDAVEAHGTGTVIGDPIEADALAAVFGPGRDPRRPLYVGAVKSNLGHVQAAAGVAGVIKMILALRHEHLPHTLNVDEPSPHVDWSRGLRLLTRAQAWPRGERPRRAGVSGFGISGTNAHVILEEAPADPVDLADPGQGATAVPVLLSARSTAALAASARRLRAHLDVHPDQGTADVAAALLRGRSPMRYRAVLSAPDRAGLARALTALGAGEPDPNLVTGSVVNGRSGWLFPGQGSQYSGSGARLYQVDPVFATALDEIAEEFGPHLETPLPAVLFAADGSPEADLLQHTRYTQPALFALEVALARVLRQRGLVPDLLIGHSIGELAAARVAGVLSLPDAVRLVAARSALMDGLPAGGVMVAVEADEPEVQAVLAGVGDPSVAVAAVNGPTACVVSGGRDGVRQVARVLRARGRRTKELPVSHAFHSPLMDPMLAEFAAAAGALTYADPQIPVISTLTGQVVSGGGVFSGDYWVRHVRGTVRFLDGVTRLRAEGVRTTLEVGPGRVLSAAVVDADPDSDRLEALALLRPDRDEERTMTAVLARAHARGIAVDWLPGRGERARPAVELPTYPFQHQRFWPASGRDRTDVVIRGWRYRSVWERLDDLTPSAAPTAAPLPGHWLLAVPAAADPVVVAAARSGLSAHGARVSILPIPVGSERADLAALLAGHEIATAAGIIAVLAPVLELRSPGPGGPARFDPIDVTLPLLQALAETGSSARLWCLTRQAVAVETEGSGPAVDIDPEQARVWGLGRVAALEHPRIWGGLLDLPAESRSLAAGLAAVWTRLAGPAGEDQMAVRAGGIFGRRVVRAGEPVPAGAPDWCPPATVLITGGTGGLGGQLAGWLARSGARHLVLLSRRGPAAPGAGELRARLEQLGVRVTIEAADVTDRRELQRALEQAEAVGEPVRAVFHAAGVAIERPLSEESADGLRRDGAAKTEGAAHLDVLFAGRHLDAFVLFSSIAATWGSGGLGGYAAANAALDALAVRRRACGLPATSVGWGPWAGAGMAGGQVGAGLNRHGLNLLLPGHALRALRDVLTRDDGPIAVADVEWARFAPAFQSARTSALLAGVDVAEEITGAGAVAATGAATVAPLAHLLTRSSRERQSAFVDLIRAEVAVVLEHRQAGDVDIDRPFREMGFDSLAVVDLRRRLNRATGLTLAVTAVFDHPSVHTLAGHLDALLATTAGPAPGADPPDDRPGVRAAAAGTDVAADDDPMVIVGMSCRFPGDFPGDVCSPEDLWQLLVRGGDAIADAPGDRGWGDPALDAVTGARETRRGGFLSAVGDFDAEFFGVSPREALAMDPQQRLLLETAWEALERAGIDPTSVRGTPGGVYVGVAAQGYGNGCPVEEFDLAGHVLSGTVTSVASGRVGYTLGLEGPAVTVETACSSALVALHLAGQALRAGECTFALVGAAAVMATPDVFAEFAAQGANSPDGRCRSFGAGADGTGWSEGAGMLVVERRSRAARLGHPVLAVVRASALNADGASNGLTAPNGLAQQRVIRRALAEAGLDAGDVDLVEGHGTGTRLGDPIEAQALLSTYGRDRPADHPLWLGSVKSNLGHAQAAAGIAGIIKAVQALQHAIMPATLHAAPASTKVDWSLGSVRLLEQARPWPATGRPRRAAVSAFGMSGTNAHVILEEAGERGGATAGGPAPAPAGSVPALEPGGAGPVAWLLSARSPAALRAQAARLLARLESGPPARSGDIAHVLAGGRAALEHRAVALGADEPALRASLSVISAGGAHAGVVTGRRRDGRTVFVFPGQGSQWAGMGLDLLRVSPAFAARLAECEQALTPHVGWSLSEVLRGAPGAPGLDRVDVVQPALFAVMVSLAQVWRAAGVHPDLVIGHSQGEIAAACVAGALSLPDAALVVARRSLALRRLTGQGGMVSVAASEPEVRRLLTAHRGGVDVAALNGAAATVVAGESAALGEFLAQCSDAGFRAKWVPVDYAAHSSQVERVQDELREALAPIRPRDSEIALFSTVTGQRIEGRELDAGYWYRNLREPVVFGPATGELLNSGHRIFVEVSPHPVLLPGIESTAAELGRPVEVLTTLRRDDGGADRLVASLAAAWTGGADVRPGALVPAATAGSGPVGRQPVDLPTYPFQRTRYWLPSPGRGPGPGPDRTGTGRSGMDRRPLGYDLVWRPLPEPVRVTSPAAAGTWMLVAPPAGVEDPVVQTCRQALERAGARVVLAGGVTAAAGSEPVIGVLSLLGLADDGAAATVELLGALAVSAPKARVWLVTGGAVATTAGEPVLDPQQAALWGLGPVFGLEQPQRWGGVLDLPPTLDPAGADLLVAVIMAGPGGGEDQFALRPDGLHVRRLQHAAAPVLPAGPGSPRPGPEGSGTVLVVAGPDDPLALTIGSWLGGSGRPVQRIEVDPARPEDLRPVLDLVPGPVEVVLHCVSGVAEPQSIAGLDPAGLRTVLARTAATGQVLAEAADRLGARTGITVLPVSGVLAAAGRAAEAAVHAVLAARLHPAASVGGPAGGPDSDQAACAVFSVALGGQDRQFAATDAPLSPAVVTDVLDGLLQHRPGATIVADLRWDRLVSGVSDPRQLRLLSDLPEMIAALRSDRAEESDLVTRLAPLPAAQQRAALLRLVREQAAATLGYPGVDSIDPERAFSEAGFDSVLSVQFRNGLCSATGLTLSPAVVFDHPNAVGMAEFLQAEMFAGTGAGALILAELDRLDEVLSGLPPERGDDDGEIAERLGRLIRRWGERGGADAGRAAPRPGARPPAAGLDSASAEELFDLLDTEFGRA